MMIGLSTLSIEKIAGMLWSNLVNTSVIALSLFGIFFILGILLYFLARSSRIVFAKSLGPKAEIFITAWVGTPVHELGHALFCLIFGHQIKKIRFFTPNSKDGTLGMVEHAYNRRNIYHQIGNFFIGAGPVILGSAIIWLILYFLMPGGRQIINLLNAETYHLFSKIPGISETASYLKALFTGVRTVAINLFTGANLSDWRFWVFFYLIIAIASHMELSPPDLRQMGIGFIFLFILMFTVTLVYTIFFPQSENILLQALPWIAYLNQTMFFALLLSIIYFVVVFVLLSLFHLIFRGKLINPFTR